MLQRQLTVAVPTIATQSSDKLWAMVKCVGNRAVMSIDCVICYQCVIANNGCVAA